VASRPSATDIPVALVPGDQEESEEEGGGRDGRGGGWIFGRIRAAESGRCADAKEHGTEAIDRDREEEDGGETTGTAGTSSSRRRRGGWGGGVVKERGEDWVASVPNLTWKERGWQ